MSTPRQRRSVKAEPIAATPVFKSCPNCGLPLQVGKGPNGLAWHDCDFVIARRRAPATLEEVEQTVLGRLRDAAESSSSSSELIAVLQAIREMRGLGGGGDRSRGPTGPDDLAKFLTDP